MAKKTGLVVVVMVLLAPLLQAAPPQTFHAKRYKHKKVEDQAYWNSLASEEIQRAERISHNNKVAKNVILFLGDGMSIPTLTAARIYKGQMEGRGGEEGSLFFENFPHVGLSKTYNVDRQVSDSASTATAYLTGVKTKYKTLGVDGSVKYQDCSSITEQNKVYSIVKWAQDAGKRTGIVTSTRITHATPAATYCHSADRDWECDESIPQAQYDKCEGLIDIATQLVYNEPGRSINVVMGGGYQHFDANATETDDDPFTVDWPCRRQNTTNLIDAWRQHKDSLGATSAFARYKSDLDAVDTSDTDYLLGLFANDHLPYEYMKREDNLDVPTLQEMTEAAIEILSRGDNGYFLLVEGGRIDHAHHDTQAHRALDETVAMDEAIQYAVSATKEEDTLIVVTADHAHTMSISGYPYRGQEIIGLAALGDDGLPYTTLMYANGPGYNYQVVEDHVERPNITNEMAKSWTYEQLAAVPKDSETHGGDDVAIYALGPMSHLFHSLHEQNYIAHVMAHSACIGSYKKGCRSGGERVGHTLTLAAIIATVMAHLGLRA